MTGEITAVFAIIILAMVLFFTEKFSIDTISVLVMALFMVTGILTFDEGISGFSNTATVTVGAMFVLSAAIFKSGSLNNLNKIFLRMSKKNEFLFMLTMMVFAGGLSAFINDTAVVAILMPTVIKIAKDTGMAPSKLLMPLSFGALMGGVCTLLGTSTNILVSGIAEKNGLEPFGIFEMSGMGLVFLISGLIYMLTIGRWLSPDRPVKRDLTEIFDLGDYLTEISIKEDFKDIGTSIKTALFFNDHEIEALQIVRKDGEVLNAYPYSVIKDGDTIRISCDKETLKVIKDHPGVSLKVDLKFTDEDLETGNTKLYEAMVTPHSYLVDKTLKSINFRDFYSGNTVLGIRHRNDIKTTKLTHSRLSAGDVLLIRSEDKMINKIRNSSEDLLIISEEPTFKFSWKKMILTLGIVIMVVLLATFKIFPIAVAAITGCVMLILLRSLTAEEAYKAVDWKVIFMLAGILSMGVALEKTGAADLLARGLTGSLGQYGPTVVMSSIFGITFLATNIMSNNATAALLAPIAIAVASSMQVSERPFIMAVTFAASLSFMTPMGYQTNTMIYTPGNYKFVDYLKIGTPLNLMYWVLATLFLPYFFPF
ncbi:SLC13 family permease [Litoribacter populi]|uniref:SLC13 family permease n=1 Tax=Litoribacter populi TaxID=2598460 RepID=UPI00117F3FFE|nr:SLC13 family permease [Litoribacter populi]